jgi:putative protease
MKKVELLAPAKNLETAIAAINCGADAVYIGASDFGARKNAPNSLDDIKKLVEYAHLFNVRVHVTVNTILTDNELKDAVELINKLYGVGIDAVIIQDMGLLKAAIDGKLPPVELHMSTQCDNRTLEKVKFFNDVGVSRVILARELSKGDIAQICSAVDCEIETFVHGALCVSYSGQCYMSYANGGRSANRGECAQPCRKKYSLIDNKGKVLFDNKYLLSLKDFNASEEIKDLIDCGVKSFKIEGRLKDINYVKNVVAYYNNLINKYALKTSAGSVFIEFEPDLYKTFNRGYTDYFLNSRGQCFNFLSPKSKGEKLGKVKAIGKNYIEIDAKVYPQDGLCYIEDGKMKGFLVNRVIGNKIYPNKMPKILSGTVIYRNFNYDFDKKLSFKTTRKIAVKYVIKANKIYVFDEDGNNLSEILPDNELATNLNKMKQNLIKQLKRAGDSIFYVSDVIFEDDNIPFLPVSVINNIRRELLRMLTELRLSNYKKSVQKPIGYATFPCNKMGYKANVLNNEAKLFYKNCNCQITEDALESSKTIPSGIELMRTKHCLKYAAGLCSKPCGKLYLVDKDNNKKYPLNFDCKNCEMVVLNP